LAGDSSLRASGHSKEALLLWTFNDIFKTSLFCLIIIKIA
jgi:hypothetical protein